MRIIQGMYTRKSWGPSKDPGYHTLPKREQYIEEEKKETKVFASTDKSCVGILTMSI